MDFKYLRKQRLLKNIDQFQYSVAAPSRAMDVNLYTKSQESSQISPDSIHKMLYCCLYFLSLLVCIQYVTLHKAHKLLM